MSDDDLGGFATPPFKPDEALQRLKRDWRGLGLSEREGVFEQRGQAVAHARVDGDAIEAAVVRQPGRTPQWQAPKRLRDAAALRDFTAGLKKSLAQWSDHDD